MNTKMLVGMYNAPKEKRYRSFVTRSADSGEVWLLQSIQAITDRDEDQLYVWPNKEFALMYCSSSSPVMMDVEDFLSECRNKLSSNTIIHVFPNHSDSYDVLLYELLDYLQEEVDRI